MVADFVSVTKNRQAAAYKFSFEVDEQNAQHLLMILGGLPVEGESRPVVVWCPTITEIRQARKEAAQNAKKITGSRKALPAPEESEEEE